jgi:sulfur carrier protein
MRITVNGVESVFEQPPTLAELLRRLGVDGQVAVEVNREVVPRSRHPEFRPQDGDAIEIVRAIGGG